MGLATQKYVDWTNLIVACNHILYLSPIPWHAQEFPVLRNGIKRRCVPIRQFKYGNFIQFDLMRDFPEEDA